MADVDVVASYEWWGKANATNHENNGHVTSEEDIRALDVACLPKKIDIVVGSPPCTQFSFSNRGGGGDLVDGLKDIAKFLEVIDYIRPRFWAMENVPRVAKIVEKELKVGGQLHHFAHLECEIHVLEMQEWGLPQRRKRCVIGNIDFELLHQYRDSTEGRTLGDVVRGLSRKRPKDAIYGIELGRAELTDHEMEEFLSPEEERMNREMKTHHPVYNNMAFPDPLDRTSRTITATCTRVSRESVVINESGRDGEFRRLTVRERALIQGFPITYQFFGDSYSQKLKMIGNAIPPLLTFYIGQAIREVDQDELLRPEEAIIAFTTPAKRPDVTRPDTKGASFPARRRFRVAIPHLRFKSGMRFELANSFSETQPEWRVRFFYGNSKNISEVPLDEHLLKEIEEMDGLIERAKSIGTCTADLEKALEHTNATKLQAVWAHKAKTGQHPYGIVDEIGKAAQQLMADLAPTNGEIESVVAKVVQPNGDQGVTKVLKNADAVMAGLILGAKANEIFRTDRFHKIDQ